MFNDVQEVFQAQCRNCSWTGPLEESKDAAYGYCIEHINTTKHDCLISTVLQDNQRQWQARCETCFWTGPLEDSEDAAYYDYNKHIEEHKHLCVICNVGK